MGGWEDGRMVICVNRKRGQDFCVYASLCGWLQYRLANKRGVAGTLDALAEGLQHRAPGPGHRAPPGIEADGFAAGLRRNWPQ